MSDKPNKPNKLKARLPRGLADRGPAEIAATRAMIEKIRVVYERYGFDPVETPAIEYTDALGKFLPDQDRPNEGVFSFQDDDEQWLSLRYDLTAPLARYVAENFDALPKPYRSYRFGWVFRNEKPGPGRFRQFMQFDADTVGSASPAADAEMCMMAADTMEALGLHAHYVVKVNNRKVLDGVLETIGLGGETNAGRRLTVLRAIDKYDRLGREGVEALLGSGRKDDSGDFTKGAGLDAPQIQRVLNYVEFQLDEAMGDLEGVLSDWSKELGSSAIGNEGIQELTQIAQLVRAANYGADRISIDSSVVRGLEYYTGPVFEVDLTFPIAGDDGKPIRFGSVGGGGRYDGLVSRFRGQPVPATGFSIGVSRLAAALERFAEPKTTEGTGPVVVAVFFDRDSEIAREYLMKAQQMAQKLRNAGIRAEVFLGNPKNIGNQFKYADKRGAPCVVIQGPDEKANRTIQIKDLISGTDEAIVHEAFDTSRREYLEQRLAQFPVAEDTLVEKVRALLAQHGIGTKS
ncbi:MAG: histidine--tRNA ligase [Xanthobacteraceae bacterium]